MRRIAVMALAVVFMAGCRSQAANNQQSQDNPAEQASAAAMNAAAAATATSQPEVASMDWSQVTGGVLKEAPYPVYPGATLGMASDYGPGIYVVSSMTPDGGAKVDAFYSQKMTGWTRRELPGGSIIFVKGAQAKATGFANIVNGPGLLIEPRENGSRPYTLITFQVRKSGD